MSTDLEKARDIVKKAGPFVGTAGTLREDIAKAVAQGIAAGRREAMLEASQSIARMLAPA